MRARYTFTGFWRAPAEARSVSLHMSTSRIAGFARRFRQCPSPSLVTQSRRFRPNCPTSAASQGHPAAAMTRDHTKKANRKGRTLSLEDTLLRQVNSLVGGRNAAAAVQIVRAALQGTWVPPKDEAEAMGSGSSATCCSPGAISTPQLVFSTKAFAAALFACEAAGDAVSGLSLVDEVRRYSARGISTEWLQAEHVLSVILRLQCMADDRDGATRMFAYLEQHGLLRLRSVSALLQYCCGGLKDRRLSFAVYEVALKHKIELTEPDYFALGLLCVQVREPVGTLFFMLEQMREHIAEVTERMVREVLVPWVKMANDDAAVGMSRRGAQMSLCLYTVAAMLHVPPRAAVSTTLSTVSSTGAAAPLTGAQLCGICPACQVQLSGYPFTAACRSHLLRELTELIIPQACRNRRARLGFEHWRRYIQARLDAGNRVDVFIDGANLGYYGLSSWYAVAKKRLMLHRGVPESQITDEDLDFNTQCRAAGRSVDVGVSFELIDSAVNIAVNTYGLRRPLVMLHERHVEPKFMTPQSAAIVQRWRDRGWLYCCPTGLNDDLCWLYGALLLTDPLDTMPNLGKASAASSHCTFVCTNDKMRDHHFRLLSPRAFTRWRDRHRIAFHCVRLEDRTELHWEMPAPYERCIQRHEVHSALSQRVQEIQPTLLHHVASHTTAHTGTTDATGAGTILSWHIPFTPASRGAATVTPVTFGAPHDDKNGQHSLCGGQTAPMLNVEDTCTAHHHPASLPKVSGDQVMEEGYCIVRECEEEEAEEEDAMSTTPAKLGPWVCITVCEKEEG
ncbi:hypothetical protein JKF63_02223 [Porcisia hertigi]|uniref:Uncharacterized protein n=1 Tax=Porcisia hertigi TaxID=2761500 RepID=A0A836I7S8_9TRYP|nr:hypothetical protein JKF63_02223 [Porcisia hertigi]